jgi:hypothetical protein
MQRSQGFPWQLAGLSPSRFTGLGSYRGDMNTNLPKGRESEPAVGWSRVAQDAAESRTVASHENVATQPFPERRIGYGTTGALLITAFVLLTIVTAVLAMGSLMGPTGPTAPCLCF